MNLPRTLFSLYALHKSLYLLSTLVHDFLPMFQARMHLLNFQLPDTLTQRKTIFKMLVERRLYACIGKQK